MRKSLLAAAMLIMVIVTSMAFLACTNNAGMKITADVERIPIAVGGTASFHVRISDVELGNADTYTYRIFDNSKKADIVSVEYVKIGLLEYKLNLKGLKEGNQQLTIIFEENRKGLVTKQAHCNIYVSVLDAAIEVIDVKVNAADLKLGYEYEFTPVTYPEGKLDGLDITSSDDGILRRVDGEEGALFRVVGIGTCDMLVNGKTISEYTKTFKTVAGDEGIGAFLTAAFPANGGRITANDLNSLTSIELDSRFPAKDLTALNVIPSLETVSLQSLSAENLNLKGLKSLRTVNTISCNKLETVSLSDMGALSVTLAGSNVIKKFSIDNATSLNIEKSDIYKVCDITEIDIANVGAINIYDGIIPALVTARFEGIGSFGVNEFNFVRIREAEFVNCVIGSKLNFTSVASRYDLKLCNSTPGNIYALGKCKNLHVENVTLHVGKEDLDTFFNSTETVNMLNVYFDMDIFDTDYALNIVNNNLLVLKLVAVNNIDSLSIKSSKLNELKLSGINALTKLNVQGSGDEGAYTISDCANVNTLVIKKAPSVVLSSLLALKWLQIEYSGAKVLDLSGCPAISVLICNSNPLLTEINCKNMRNLEYLEAVSMPALTTLNINGAAFLKVILAPANPQFSAIVSGLDEQFVYLEKLQINDCNFKSIDFVKNMPGLKVLDVANNDIGDIVAVGRLDKLEELYLNGNNAFNHLATDAVTNATALERVAKNLLRLSVGVSSVSSAPTGDAAKALLKVLAAAVKLEWLQAYNLNFTTVNFTANVSENIKYLDVRGNKSISSEELIKKFQSLERLVVGADDDSGGYHGENTTAAGAQISISIDKNSQQISYRTQVS